MMTYIYQLLEGDQVRYVGKSRDPRSRFYGHLSPRENATTPTAAWIRSLLAEGRRPTLRIVRRCRGDGLAQERQEIRKAFVAGHPILNVYGNRRRTPPRPSKYLRCDRIHELRIRRGMTIRMASAAAGMDPCQWCDIESGRKTNLIISTLDKIGHALRVDICELMQPLSHYLAMRDAEELAAGQVREN